MDFGGEMVSLAAWVARLEELERQADERARVFRLAEGWERDVLPLP